MTISLAQHVTATDTGDGMVLLDERSGRYWQMNGTGAMILGCILDSGSAESAAATLRDRYSSAGGRITVDVQNLLNILRSQKLVTS
jgi:hypothetical protein